MIGAILLFAWYIPQWAPLFGFLNNKPYSGPKVTATLTDVEKKQVDILVSAAGFSTPIPTQVVNVNVQVNYPTPQPTQIIKTNVPITISQNNDIPIGYVPIMNPFGNNPMQANVPPGAQEVRIKFSYYWPAFGGINCRDDQSPERCLFTANGDRVEQWIGRGAACPDSLAFGTKVYFSGYVFECVDRGGKIVKEGDNTYWIDVMYPWAPKGLYWGQELKGYIQP